MNRAVAVVAALGMAWAGAVQGSEGVRLTAALEAHLASLPAIRGAVGEAAERGAGPSVVTFFASWCPPCRDEFVHLAKLQRTHADAGLRVVAVNVFEAFDDNDGPRLERFLRDTDPPFAVVEGSAETRALFGDVARIPTVFVFDASGSPVLHFIHERGAKKMTVTAEELDAAVALALSGETVHRH